MLTRPQRALLRSLPRSSGKSSAFPRLASTATQISTEPRGAVSLPRDLPPPERLSRRTPLYTVPPLPPLPPPLPADVAGAQAGNGGHTYAPTSISHNAQGAQEQLAVLNACLASGDIARAEEVAKRIRLNWIKSGKRGALSDLLPSRVHADFLRAYLSSALVPQLPHKSVNLSTASSKGRGDNAALPDFTQGNTATRSRLVSKAWAYFDSLLSEEWDGSVSSRGHADLPMGGSFPALDPSIFAVMFKGLVAAGPATYHPNSLTDPEHWLRPITHLLPHLRSSGHTLVNVLRDPIFLVDLPSYLGHVDRSKVLDALCSTGEGRSGWDEWEGIVRATREELAADEQGREAARRQVTRDVPELLPTTATDDAPNVSLETLRTNLSTLGMPDFHAALTPSQRQRLLEESSYDAARQLYIHEMEELAKVGKDKERGMQSNWLQGVMFDWMKVLERSLTDASTQTGKGSPWGRESDIEPFMRLLKPDKMALITIVELLRLCGAGGVSDGMKAARAILHIGKAIENEYHAQVLQAGFPNKAFEREMERIAEADLRASAASSSPSTLGDGAEDAGRRAHRTSEQTLDIFWRRELAKREKEGDTSWRPAWSQGIRAKVGSILITALMDVAKVERTVRHPRTGELITESQPAFSHAYQYVRGLKLGIIKINPVVAERMDQDPLRITLHPRFLPMVVKPKPWLSWNSGSYLVHSTQIMRTKDSDEQIRYLKQASDADTLDQIFTGLDVLGSVPWKINRQVFEVVSTVWNTGEELADIPAKTSLTAPLEAEKPDNMDTDPRAKDTYRHRIRKALQDRRAAHSTRCDANYKLEIGRAFLDETFYFPHNLDFRGRAYPIPPNLSHIGNDMCRGLLMFAEAKPLGERGLRWLKIHLANLSGYDKASFDEREAFAMEHLDDVFDSADHPLDGKRWWLKADDPWQCLATCFELAAALRSPNPLEYECGLPIHQDGTCNGLQHYAALGGDLKGANQVNLEAGDRPADVYSGVSKMANEVIDRDAAAGVPEAILLQGKVSRKVVKQTVMTTVYGVTFIGAKKQIEKQLKERGDIPAENLYMCSLYLGRIVLDSIGDVFKGATAIQTWLNRSARLISKSIPPSRIANALQAQIQAKSSKRGSTASAAKPKKIGPTLSRIPKEQMTSVVWTTPLGLPVVQPYRKAKKRQVATALQTVFIVDPSIPAEVDPRAQATAFPPNFIHSLDATHMMMTALACKDKIAFASVHDSYWTHACSVDEMSVILREAFIELHSQDILGKLRQEFIERYDGHVVPVSKVPAGLKFAQAGERGELNIVQPTAPKADSATNEVAEVISELDSEDGDAALPLFAQSQKIKRVPTGRRRPYEDHVDTLSTGIDSDAEDSVTPEEDPMTKFFQMPPARGIDSKLVYLSDILPPVPSKGDFDLDKIRHSLYFFS